MGKLSKQNKNLTPKSGWKFEDDYLGISKYSEHANTDENGYKTVLKPDDFDPRRRPPRIIKEQLPSWTRPAQDNPDVDASVYDDQTDY